MTTAARATFESARGSKGSDLAALSKQYSSRDLPSHTKLKMRCVCTRVILDKAHHIFYYKNTHWYCIKLWLSKNTVVTAIRLYCNSVALSALG